MTTFDKREKGFENAFAHEEKISFDVEAKCSKLYGLWAAEKLGLSADEAKTYAMEVVSANLDEPGFDDVLRKVKADFDLKGLQISDKEMKLELDKALEKARQQVIEERK